MVKKTDSNGDKPTPKAKKERFNEVKFVNRELTKEEAAELKEMPLWSEDWSSWFTRACDAGYSFSIRYDAYSEAFACFVSTKKEDDDNFGCILTGRGSEPLKALRQALYKHWRLAECQWNRIDRSLNFEIDD